MASESEDEEYAYSSEDEELYPEEDMGWDKTDNPNAAPVKKSPNWNAAANPVKSGIRMLDAKDVRPEMLRRLREVTELLDISEATALVLLNHTRWSKEALLESYMTDSDKILREAGVYHRVVKQIQPATAVQECPICYEVPSKTMSMPCGHAFCYDCWVEFCENSVQEGPVCLLKTCPFASCPERLTVTEWEASLAPDSTSLAKIQSFQLRSFVDSSALTRWCPGRGCERIACALTASAMESEGNVAACDACDTHFCMICGEEPHSPASCKDLEMWMEKCRNESETANWILANTKSCPRCVSRIEKNQGCNHMTCQRCKFEFCWICMGDWNEHGANTGGYYKCNKYDTNGNLNANMDDQSDAAKAKRDLDRYLHFYKRFHAHAEAQKFAKKQLKETETRMVMLQEQQGDTRWSDVEFLKTANEQLVECRKVLKYTYVYGYYLDPNRGMERERFEHHQEMLEKFTENLSELSEKPLEQMDRTDVVNQTRVVDRFMKNVLKHVDDGMDET